MTPKDQQRLNMLYKMLTAYKTMHTIPQAGDPEHNDLARVVSNTIHDLNGVWTGYISKAAIQAVSNNDVTISQLCNEHFNPRQRSGAFVLKAIDELELTFDQFVQTIEPLCLVHKTLSSENNRLVEHQVQLESWIEAYHNAGIQLVNVGICNRLRRERIDKNQHTEPTDLDQIDLELHQYYFSSFVKT